MVLDDLLKFIHPIPENACAGRASTSIKIYAKSCYLLQEAWVHEGILFRILRNTLPRAISGNGPQRQRHFWQRWQRGICNLWISNPRLRFDPHLQHQNKSF